MSERIFLSSPHMSDEGYEMEYVKKAFDTNWIAPLGENVNKFEEEFAEMIDIKAAAALSSGTAALHLALKSAGVSKNDIVFCQSLTFSASANPILYEGAIPVFIDSNETTWNMCPKALEQAFKKYPNVKAVIVVHLYGLSAEMDEIVALCKEHGVALIEDAAESLGSTYKGRQTGTFGDYGIFSFNGNKIITTSGGGMLVSNNEEKIEKAKFWATQAREQARHYEHKEIGYNYRLSNVLAGIGRGQLKVLNQRVKKKTEIYKYYKKNLKDINEISFMPANEWDLPNYWLSAITLHGDIRPVDVIEALEKENIEARPLWKPMHKQPVFEQYDYIGEDVAENLFETGLCLPSDTKMTEEELERTVTIIKGIFK